MENRIDFTFEYEYNQDGSNKVLLKREYTYLIRKQTHYKDLITITEGKIIIQGSRSQGTIFKDCLKSTKSSLYIELQRCIIYAYMVQGKPFKKGSCHLKYYNVSLHESDFGTIDDICKIELEKEFLLDQEVCESLFDHDAWAENFSITLSEFITAVNTQGSDAEVLLFEYWKAFNTLYRYYYQTQNQEQGQEYEQLNCIQGFIENNLQKNSLSLTLTPPFETQILNFKINSFLLNKKKKTKHPGESNYLNIKNYLLGCNDQRLVSKYREILNTDRKKSPEKRSFAFSDQSFKEITRHFDQVNKNHEIEFVIFAAVQYGYFLRCKYFHGEKSTPSFFIQNNPDVEEIRTVTKLLKALLIDLYRELSISIKLDE